MNHHELFSYSVYEEQTHIAELELSAYIKAVTDLLGPEQAELAKEDWLDEADLIDVAPRSNSREWRSITVAASARLSNRLASMQHHRAPLLAPLDTKVSTILSSNSCASVLLV